MGITLAITTPAAAVFSMRRGRSWLRRRSPVVRFLLVCWSWLAFLLNGVVWMYLVVTR